MNYPTPHKNYFTPNNEFIGTRTLSKELIEKSKSFFYDTLWQTNTNDKESVDIYKAEFRAKSKIFFEEKFKQDYTSFENKFCISVIENYSTLLDNYLAPDNIKSISSNENQIKKLLDHLTEIFYLKDEKYNSLGQIWTLFLENIYSHIEAFSAEEKEINFFSVIHLKSVKERFTPIKWGWYEIHIQCFVNGLIKTVEEAFTLNLSLDQKQDDFLFIYDFSIEINKRIKQSDYGIKISDGFSTLGDYLSINQEKLESCILSFYSELVEKSFKSTIIFSANDEKARDFIDMINGKDRKEKEMIFNNLIFCLLEKNIVKIEDDLLIFITADKGNRAGAYLAGFVKTCEQKQIICLNEFHKGKHIKQSLIITFNLNPKGLSDERFENKKYRDLDKTYMEPYAFLPNIKELKEQQN